MYRSTSTPARVALVLALALGPAAPALGSDGCLRCHADAELLAQQAGTPDAARLALVAELAFAGSAHGGMACRECHAGVDAFPHEPSATTRRCASCHEGAAAAVARSLHADATLLEEGGESCRRCHGTHDVARATGEGHPGELSARCASCHREATLGTVDVHRDEVGCQGCHGGHDIVRLAAGGDPASRHALLERCGHCHGEAWAAWSGDAHGQATLAARARGEDEATTGGPGQPTCTSCHRSHDMAPVGHAVFTGWSIVRCSRCHAGEAASATGTYHIRARELGSEVAASCADCHGAHGIFPSDDERSWTGPVLLLGTCQACHEEATAGFAEYQPHPEPTNRTKNPWVFASFWFMNLLLAGVLGVFLLHTFAWWIRIALDRRRAAREGGTP